MTEILEQPAEEHFADVELLDPFSGLAHRRSRLPQRDMVPVIDKVVTTFPAGVTIVAALSADGPVGLTVGTMSRLSSDPPLLLFSVSRTSRTWASIQNVGSCCASLLSEHQVHVAMQFAGGHPDRFAEIAWRPSLSLGMPAISAALACIECTLESSFPGGDHLIVVGRVVNAYYQRRGQSTPLLSYRHEFWKMGDMIPSS